MATGPGYGNKTATYANDDHDGTTYGSSLSNSDSYSGGTTLGSGTTGGPGFGNKTSPGEGSSDDGSTRLGIAVDTNSYSNPTLYGSGTTSGPGFGNKTSGSMYDSTTGKLMEKAGAVFNNETLVEKGKAKRESNAAGEEE